MIKTAWNEQKAIKEVMIFLQTHGVSTTYAVKIYKNYGVSEAYRRYRSIGIVTNNPYQLATDIYGIGFITADQGIGGDAQFKQRFAAVD